MQCTIRQRRHLECKTDERVGHVVTTSQVENEPKCCGILGRLETLNVSERRVGQETVAIVNSVSYRTIASYQINTVVCDYMYACFQGCSQLKLLVYLLACSFFLTLFHSCRSLRRY